MQMGKKNEEDIFDRQFEILSSWNTIYLELRKEEISGGRRGFSSEEERSKRSVTARVTKFCRKSKIFLGYLCRLSINIETIETSGMPFPGRDKSLLDTWGKHQKCVSRHECSTRSKCIFAWTFTNTKRPLKCARSYKHNNKPLELTEAERGISNPSTRASRSPLGHPFVPFFPLHSHHHHHQVQSFPEKC